ncbi:putative 60s ribosomal protein L34e [Monocercomonoides exilis]|uniref:putative 60s ribosomal protein L34e n=1 Tax=Monocercomonoides exilis TaxID=2049356 RepID=UPI00355948A6|nr:putative 60s ribosomal protein L34e [Monocercomonoides exilis]|eukprot:MONOS_1967.1-p1 / transcript=MONOS_1967.1 / gene=MONOS_1967 / organism=Monocercomonoides_exilis_PA203 / gene_product=60s ribosomal protein L34e / transcript_product=60s ribosomal protein L34e / location=Mono_scaffold00038:8861-9528(-) / protein_length=184 / sequence_SO=supercontig / SO=protein_coding / is_pseudo=false
MVQRLTLRRRNPYHTQRNRVISVKTPGGKLVYHYIGKRSQGPKCGDCHADIQGVPCLVRRQMAQLSRPKKHVSRAYGGSRCAKCVRNRIIRAFLTEEQKIVKRLRKAQEPKLLRRQKLIEKQKAAQAAAARERAKKLAEEREAKKREKKRDQRREGGRRVGDRSDKRPRRSEMRADRTTTQRK